MRDISYSSGFENYLRLYEAGSGAIYVSITDNEDYGSIDRKFATEEEAVKCYTNTKQIFEECAHKLRSIGWKIEAEEYHSDEE